MAILEKEILTGVTRSNVTYYEKLGYTIPKSKDGKISRSTKIIVKIEDLTKGSNVRVTKICDDCGEHLNNITYSSIILLREKGDGKDRCKKCGTLNAMKLIKENVPYERSLEFFAKGNNKEYILEEFSDKNEKTPDKIFRASNDSLYWNCLKCKSEFISKPCVRTCHDVDCPFCAGQKVNHTNSLASIIPELAKEWHPVKNKNLTPNDVSFRSNKTVWWKCSIDPKHEWEARIETRSSRNYGCPVCAEPKGEKRIRRWLQENKFYFVPQMEFEGLIGLGGGNLSYDFYLPKQNILIEYQGQFHDGKENDYVRQNLEYQQEHDKRKSDFAKQNEINLLEIWYWDFNNIEEILNKQLQGGVE